jgi:hypothetical protein
LAFFGAVSSFSCEMSGCDLPNETLRRGRLTTALLAFLASLPTLLNGAATDDAKVMVSSGAIDDCHPQSGRESCLSWGRP